MKSYARNVMTIKSDNRALIFNYIRSGPISRSDISKQTGMSKSSVTTITNALIEEGQLTEIGSVESEKGRRPVLLDIVPDHRYAIGVSLHRKNCYVCICDLKSHIVAYSNYPTNRFNCPYALMEHACEEIERLLVEQDIPLSRCIGIGISSPGPVDNTCGKILNPPNFELFHNIEVGKYFKERFGLPTTAHDNAVLLAMQERLLDPQQKNIDYIYVAVSNGIGSAIMINNQIHQGLGSLGHTSIHADGIQCSCGNRGCLECYVSMSALSEKFRFSSYEHLIDDAYLGDSESLDAIGYIADELSCALINAINLLDLDAVIIYGELSYRSDKLCEALSKRINERSVVTQAHDVKVTFSKLTPDLVRASACAAILEQHFNQELS